MTRVLAAAGLGAALIALAATPVSARSPEEVQALVERAADYILQHGRQQAFADFSRPDGGFVDGELYLFCDDATGKVLAHGDNPKLIGKSLFGVRDAEGNSPTAELFRIAQTKGQGWYEYLWPNPVKGRVERKVAYAVRIDDQTVCASGFYKPDPPPTDQSRPDQSKPDQSRPDKP